LLTNLALSISFLFPFQHDSLKGGKWSNGAAMTEEEAAAAQQRMFDEARARMNGGVTAPKQPETNQSLKS
jgi:hypothetical protein